jgi:hypothetical protein
LSSQDLHCFAFREKPNVLHLIRRRTVNHLRTYQLGARATLAFINDWLADFEWLLPFPCGLSPGSGTAADDRQFAATIDKTIRKLTTVTAPRV